MASIKREIVLGCFMVLCTVLFIVFNPNRYQLVFEEVWEHGVHRVAPACIDSLTGKIQLLDAPTSKMRPIIREHQWYTYPERENQDN